MSILLNLISFINVFPQQSIDVLNTNVVALNSSVLTLITIMGRTDRDHHQLMEKVSDGGVPNTEEAGKVAIADVKRPQITSPPPESEEKFIMVLSVSIIFET